MEMMSGMSALGETIPKAFEKALEKIQTKKRKRDEEDLPEEEEVELLALENLSLVDNQHDQLDFKMRNLIRPINGDPNDW